MRPIIITAAANGGSQWVPVNELQIAFAIGLAGIITSGASLTWKVQHTLDDPSVRRLVSVSRSTTVATVVDNDHRLSVGDTVLISGTGAAGLDSQANTVGGPPWNIGGLGFIAWPVASVVDANTYTYTVANSGATTDQGNTWATSLRVFDHPVMTAQTGRLDGNYAYPVQAIRLFVSSYSSGKVDLLILQGMGR